MEGSYLGFDPKIIPDLRDAAAKLKMSIFLECPDDRPDTWEPAQPN